MNRRSPGFWIAIVIVALSAIGAMLPLTHADFTNWDDPHTVSENPELLPPTLTSLGHLWRGPRADLYVPVTYTFWWTLAHAAVDRGANGEWTLHPQTFHTANVALHVLSSVLVFLVLRRLVSSIPAACIGAVLFAVHPVQVESVGWISGAKDLLCGLLSVAAIHQYLCYAQRSVDPSIDPRKDMRLALHWIAAGALLVLAMLAKPAAICVPWICLAIDRTMIRHDWKRPIRGTVPLVLLTIPIIAITQYVQPAAMNTTLVSPLLRPVVALDALAFYLGKLVWPAVLTVDYAGHPQAIVASGAIWWTWVIPAALAIAASLAAYHRRRVPPFATGLIVAVLALAPVLGLASFDFQEYSTVADHYLYLPMLGIAIVVAALLCALMQRRPGTKWAAIPISFLILASLAVRSSQQTSVWRDSKSLFTHQMIASPQSFLGFANIVPSLIDEGKVEEAGAMARRSIVLRDTNPTGWMSLGYVELERKNPGAAIDAFRKSIELQKGRGHAIEAHVNLANALGQSGDFDGAIDEYRFVLTVDPKNRIAGRMLPKVIAYRDSLRKRKQAASSALSDPS